MADNEGTNFENIIRFKIEEIRSAAYNSLFPEFSMRDDLKDEADIAESSIQSEMRLMLARSQRKCISALETALGRLRTGTFGICAECEEPISEHRLIAKPESTLCFDCQEKMERKSRLWMQH